MRPLLAEFVGTFAIVFAGTGAIIINDVSHGMISHLGISLTFGLIVMAMIVAVGDVSGAHMNPAVTIAFCLARQFPMRRVVPYLCAQFTGAIAASLMLRSMFPSHETLGATIPAGSAGQSFAMELMLTFFLMLVILSIACGAKESGVLAGIAIGGVVALEALFAGPISGASMNPARSLAPAIISGRIDSLWIYLTAPVLGASLAVAFHRILHSEKWS